MQDAKDTWLTNREKWVSGGISLLHPLTIVSGENATLKDAAGREYIDFTSGIGVSNLGHNHPELVQVAREQLGKPWHLCIMVTNYPSYVDLAEDITAVAPGGSAKQVMFANSGAEAVENAIKIARQHTGRICVVPFENSFHGRTYMTMSTTAKYEPYKVGFEPFNAGVEIAPYPYCYRCPFKQEHTTCGLACLEYLEKFFFLTRVPADRIAAFLFEPLQGEGGFVQAPVDYVDGLRRLAEENGALLIVDEIQTGFGRTGKMFATEHYGLDPDLMTVGKAISNGLPLSGVIGKKTIMEKVAPGSIGGTYGGNPVACAVASKVIEIMKRDDIPRRAERLGNLARRRLEEMQAKYDIIGDVRGLGIMLAIELVKDRRTKEPAREETKRIVQRAREKGLLLLKAGLYSNVIRFHPPLTIEEETLNSGLDLVDDALGGYA